MTLSSHGILSAVELAFFGPSMLIAAVLCFRHGFNTKYGWFYLLTLSLLRIIGAAVTLYSDVNNDYSTSLLVTAAITSSIGTAPLLLALMGFQERIHQGMAHAKGVSMLVFRPIHLISLAALIIAIVGGTNESSASASSEKTGRALMQAAGVLFLAMFLALAAITLLALSRTRFVIQEEHLLLRATVIVLPFLLVRIIYTVLTVFSTAGSVFYYRAVDIWAQAFMQFLMEAVVVTLFIVAGAMTPKWIKAEAAVQDERAGKDLESSRAGDDVPLQQQGRVGGRTQYQVPAARTQPQQERSLGDYRPSRLIRNAISSRR